MEFKTIAAPCSASLVEKRSKFIASVAPAGDEAGAHRFIAEIKAMHPGARHNVFAYLLFGGVRRCSDDGEPSGTGGLPALEAISRRGLVNVAVVVTRYFGGVLLGAPGLLRAYSGAVTLALDSAEIVVMHRCMIYSIEIAYRLLARVERLVGESGGKIIEQVYGERAQLKAVIPDTAAEKFKSAVFGATCGETGAELTGESYYS